MNTRDATSSHPCQGGHKLPRSNRRTVFTAIVGVSFICIAWAFREPIRHRLVEIVALANEAPNSETVAQTIWESKDPKASLLAAWNSGKIVQREVAIGSISALIPPARALPPELDSVLLSAALDADMNVREAALGTLAARKHPGLAALAGAQLRDCDPLVRFLGLSHLKAVEPRLGVCLVMPLLEDPDPLIVGMTLKLVEKWSGENFGVKLRDMAAYRDEKTGLPQFRDESSAKAKAGAERARAWWAKHQAEFPVVPQKPPAEVLRAQNPLLAADFELPSLSGDVVRLRDLRGRVVLINFWTTWCPACLSGIPILIELQRLYGGNVAVIGVSLDFVPDSHGRIGGHATIEEGVKSGVDRREEDREKFSVLSAVREKVAHTVKWHGITYPVLLDEKNEVGGRYNGGELPTTVIIDGQGMVRRRFLGTRTLPVFEAMIAEAGTAVTAVVLENP